MIRKPLNDRLKVIIPAIAILILVGVYTFLSVKQHEINPKDTTIPNLTQFIEGFKKCFLPDESHTKETYIWIVEDSLASYTRLGLGFSLGVIASWIVGTMMGVYTKAESFFSLILSIFALIPPTAMIAVYFVIIGTTETFYVGLVASGIFPVLTGSIFQLVKKDVSDRAVYKAYTLGATSFEVISKVVIPQTLPRVLEIIRRTVGPAMIILIAGEFAISDVGFGYRLKMESRFAHMNVVYIYLLHIGLIGLLIDQSFVLVRRKLCPWYGD